MFILQEIHSHGMMAWRSARRTVTMTCTADSVHNCTMEAGGTGNVV